MCKKLLLLVFLLISTILHQSAFPQRGRQFSDNAGLFSGELLAFMENNLSEKQLAGIVEFNTLWDSAVFSTPEMEAVIRSSNLLLAHNARPVPHMLNYIEMLTGFLVHDGNRRHFPVWQNAFDDILANDEKNLAGINEFILMTNHLITGNLLNKSSLVSWEADGPDFRMEYDDSLRVVFDNINLMAFNHIDTLVIFNTSGVLNPLSRSWRGRGGRVNWARAGLDKGDPYATLGSYSIDLTRSEYSADSAMFTYNLYFQSPITGKLTDRVLTTNNANDASYPRFTSYRQEFSITGIYKDVDYEGGLGMEGAKLVGSGGEQNNARLYFYRNGERWLTAESLYFVFRPQGTSSTSSRILFYIENDSVFHPDMQLNYIDNTRELSVNQNQKVISRSPWYNQYHQVDMSFAQLLWKIDDQEMRLTMPRASSIGNASFESLSLFDRNKYHSLQGMDANHPLLLLRNFARRNNYQEFPAEDYARFLKRPLPQVRRQLLELTLQGFIFYDADTDIIRLRDRLNHYIQASMRRIDYDIINFVSTTNAPTENAVLNLDTYEMKINGIPRVFISRSQNVSIFPDKNRITLKRNRNFLFDGRVNAGNLSFFGRNFAFDYDNFSVRLQDIDSLSLSAWVYGADREEQARLTEVKNLIRTVTGVLDIDKPDNKSGRINNSEFPIFKSTEKSYVFYEKPEIQRGVYYSQDFYFELEPFQMDSLSTFRNEHINFRGKLVSAGIFPDIEEMLVLQEDLSLGINHTSPDTGIPAYGGRGIYFHDIRLSNDGLRGSGRLDYIKSELYSDDFVFFPDSVNTITEEFLINKQIEGVEFPSLRSKNNIVQWLPNEEIMTVRQTDNTFTLFDGQAELDGSLNIKKSGLSGTGTLSLGNAAVTAANYEIRSESFSADNSSLLLQLPGKPAGYLIAGEVSADVDLKAQQGNFTRKRDSEMITLPLNSYITDPESFTWDMDKHRVEFISSETDPATGQLGAKYISTARGQDSLVFFAPRAILDYHSGQLRADGVKYIEVADATIYPAGENILIGEGAGIYTLKDSRLTANRDNSYHKIYNASLDIEGRKSYRGSGDYDYIDELNVTHTISFDKISVNGDTETIASGTIEEEDNFMLSPRFSFAGEAGLQASQPHLNFRGGTRISHNCERLKVHPLAFEHKINPVDVLIPVPEQPMSADRERIYTGIFVATDSVHIYPAFFSTRKNWSDQLIVSAEGYLKFDPASGEYRIAALEKLRNMDIPGNIVTFNPEECIIRSEGKLELGVDLGQFRLSATGRVQNSINDNETSISGIISMDFFMSENAMELIAQQADSATAQPVAPSAYFYERGLMEMLGEEMAEALTGRSTVQGKQLRLPEELNETFVLSEIKMKWNKESRSYRSHGKIGIAYIEGVPVNKLFTGYLEITKRRSGDYLDFYIELGNENWYYFGYTRGVMQTFSSNRDYVRIIEDLALRHRRMRVSDREARYIYMLATDTKIESFFRTYRSHLKGKTLVLPDE
jgi:hypothetical protein